MSEKVKSPGLVIIRADERLKYVDKETGAVFYYKRPTQRLQRTLTKQFMKDGVLDDEGFIQTIFEESILDYENCFSYDDKGKRIALKGAEFLPDIIEGMPSNIYLELMRKLGIIPDVIDTEIAGN